MLHRTFIGSIFIVAGTTIGAGMLAIPILSLNLGFLVSCVLLTVMWLITAFSACLMVDLIKQQEQVVSLAQIAETVFGRYGKLVALLSLFSLHFSLLAAYTAGGASVLKLMFPNMPLSIIQIVFVAIFGGLISYQYTATDYANRVFFILKLILFVFVVCMLLPRVSLTNFYDENLSINLQGATVFFTSFGFHGSIPVLMQYMSNQSTARLKVCFWLGSFIPLMVYLTWEACTLGTLTPEQKAGIITHSSDLGFFAQQLAPKHQESFFSLLLKGFTLLAIITSFIGVGMGHFQLVQEQVKFTARKSIIVTLVFGLPLLICIFYPKVFMTALETAGISLCLIAILLPALISWRLNRHAKIILLGLISFSLIIIGNEIIKWIQ